jgi:hypothetical protein
MRQLFTLLLLSLFTVPFYAQQTPAPNLEWRKVDWAPHYPTGQILFSNNPGALQNQEDSAEDWWYDIEKSYDENGRNDGYMVSGFASWLFLDIDETVAGGCYQFSDTQEENCNRPILEGQEISQKLATITKYDFNGNMVWCKAYCGADEGAISLNTTSDGGYIFTGWGAVTRDINGNIIPLNPTISNPNGDTYVSVYDLMGRTLKTEKMMQAQGSTQFSTADFPNGIYLVVLSDNNGRHKTGKLVVRH